MNHFSCRFCGNALGEPFLKLGDQPLCNNYISSKDSDIEEKHYPLDLYFCTDCSLVQLAHSIPPTEIFSDYVYLSSYSESWLKHAKIYSEQVISRFNLDKNSFAIEIACNDGYLLKNFIKADIPILGIDPAKNASILAKSLGIPMVEDYFNFDMSIKIIEEYRKADLIITNNVYAHVPDINDFTAGIKNLLTKNGVWTLEFPSLKNLIEFNQFDTIYHEHFYYFSLNSIKNIFDTYGFRIFDIERISTHGGSLRIFAAHAENDSFRESDKLQILLEEEKNFGIQDINKYKEFNSKIEKIKNGLLYALNSAKAEKKTTIGYGAAGKANTLINSCGISKDLIKFIVDRNPLKQNKLMPGSRIPIYDTAMIKNSKPDYILILPWNLKDEIIESNRYVMDWGGKFIVPIPEIKIYSENK
ncbi:MAG: methyltransferase domain-containing protein [Ignavibacteriales bacterium]|nr:methyltransferase domain-containing protein [Ignavibacteriales bacterium]